MQKYNFIIFLCAFLAKATITICHWIYETKYFCTDKCAFLYFFPCTKERKKGCGSWGKMSVYPRMFSDMTIKKTCIQYMKINRKKWFPISSAVWASRISWTQGHFFVFHNPEWIFHPEIYLLYILSPSNILSPLGKESCSLIACLGKKSNSSARFKSTVNNLRWWSPALTWW